MIQNPIRKVLSTLSTQDVRALLMGGQACVLYGAAEFSRDTDIVMLAEGATLRKLHGEVMPFIFDAGTRMRMASGSM